MIAVVTGASGFLGRNLVRRLLDDGYTVRCLVRPEGRRAPDGVASATVRWDDPRSVVACEALDGADTVFHLAGATRGVGVRAFEVANVAPTRLLLQALAERRSAGRFVYMSSQAAAGPAASLDRPVTEEDAPRPVEAYGASKLAAERVVATFADRVATTVVRACSVFGPWDRAFLPLFRLARLGWVVYPGIATHWVTLLHVDDVVTGLLAAAGSGRAASRTYFLASEAPVQWRGLGEQIAAAAGRPARHVSVPLRLVRVASAAGELAGWLAGTAPLASFSRAALAAPRYWVCSGARAQQELGFRPARSLPDALRDTYLWYARHGWLGGARRPDASA